MQVRDATVGPLSGTTAVSAAFTSMQSYGMPSVSATICASIVRVPWPISVLATRIRAPRSVSASDAFDASLISPPPVKPEPWKNSERPRPRDVFGRVRLASRPREPRERLAPLLKSVRFTASRSTCSALQSLPSR